MFVTPITELLGIKYPVFQGGMAWISDGKLAAAVSNGGGLGIIASGNAPASYVRDEIRKAKSLTDKPFGVNIMLLSPYADEIADVVAEEKVAIVTTGAGNPQKYMKMWKEAGIKVIFRCNRRRRRERRTYRRTHDNGSRAAYRLIGIDSCNSCRRYRNRRTRSCSFHARSCRHTDGDTLPFS